MHAAYAYANRRAHCKPSIDFFAPAAYASIAPTVETKRDARTKKDPTFAVMNDLRRGGRPRPPTRREPRCCAAGRTRASAPPSQPLRRFHQSLQRFLIHLVSRFRGAVLVAVRDHQSIAFEVAAARHRSFDDYADVLAEHLWRHAARFHVHDAPCVFHIELDARRTGVIVNRSEGDHAAES